VVIHCTELPDLGMAREFGEKIMHKNSRTGNSGHFYIDRDGSIEEWVPVNRVAHHVRGFNSKSIGIELVNNGRYPDWFHSTQQQMTEHYPQAQIEALILLLNDLGQALPGLKLIAGHEVLDTEMIAADDNPDIMINRKLDPGVHFPWQDVLSRVPLNRYQEKF
jgi:N-acetylmuramoyl-L-alanine amidase